MAHMAAQRDSLSWNFTCQASDSRVSPAGAFTAGSGQKQDDLRFFFFFKKGFPEEIVGVAINNEAKNVTVGMF